jgi:hypothetical protein
MESVLNIILTSENVRMVAMLAFGFSGFMWFNSKMNRLEYSLNKKIDDLRYNDLAAINKRIDGVELSIKELKFNDLAAISKRIDRVEISIGNLSGTVEALTYALEKNGSLSREDKEYVDHRLTV